MYRGPTTCRADALSRGWICNDTEWELATELVRIIFQVWTEPQIDLFATRENAKCPGFVTRRYDEQALTTNALTMSWDNIIAYAFPPFPLIHAVLRKLAA